VADLDKRVAQIDRAVEAATQRGPTRGAMALVQDQKGNRAGLVRERQRQAEILAAMKIRRVRPIGPPAGGGYGPPQGCACRCRSGARVRVRAPA
jgi:hypothetical protein